MSHHMLELAGDAQASALLLEIIDATSKGPDLEPLAARVAQLIVSATATDVCFVHVLDDAGVSLTLTGATPPFDRQVGKVRLPLGVGVTGWVASTRRPAVIVDHKEKDPRYRYIPALRGTDYTSMASVPMASEPAGLVGVLNVHTRDRREFTEQDIRLLTTIGSLVAGGIHTARMHRRLAARERAHVRFADQVIAAQENERRRLAGDIHDGISQRLVSLAFHLDAADQTIGTDPAFAAEQVKLARALTERAMDEARAAIGGLRPPVLDDLGLAGALASLVRTLADIDFTVDVCERRLPDHVEIALYRIAQEALQNIVKHASATAGRLIFDCWADRARLEVSDNGRGFDVPAHRASAGSPKHYGLVSMAERAQLLNGELEILSRVGEGTTVAATIPLLGDC